MNKLLYSIYALTLFIMMGCFSGKNAHQNSDYKRLVWSDEFNYSGLPDPQKWGYDLGDACDKPCGCGWGNNEAQFYTDKKENARVENGFLIIEARHEKTGTREYSSSRLVTKNKGDWNHGRLEIRAKLPSGRGIWPAIWMLPSDMTYGGWPRSGEIDIMEHVGYAPDSIFGTVHTQRYNGMLGTQKSVGIQMSTIASDFHVYGIDWNTDRIDFLVDGKVFNTFKNRREGVDAWPFDRAFHLLLNVAVGGNWGGKKGVDNAAFPQRMLIDYVRIYQ
ncbi:MAG: glycoside hydrolase family 16 protein [Saprospiraceae bacterium]|nr:glycoside hydrolase family 16 protein [Saprospiraceae bacterium]